MNTIGVLFILLTGVLLIGGGIFLLLNQPGRLSQSRRTEGVVFGLIGRRGGHQELVVGKGAEGLEIKPKARYRPRVQFTTELGQTIEFVGQVGSRPARYQVGDPVGVIYNPQNPAEARIDSRLESWFVVMMLVGFGCLLTAMSLCGLLLLVL